MPSITLGQFIDNIEKNGVPHINGAFFNRTDYSDNTRETIIGACALGQGALNTFDDVFTQHDSFWGILRDIRMDPTKDDYYGYNFVNRIIHWNDNDKLSLTEIVARAREKFASSLNTVIEWKD